MYSIITRYESFNFFGLIFALYLCMKLFFVLIFLILMSSCGFKGHISDQGPFDEGSYQLYDDGNGHSDHFFIWPLKTATLSQTYSMHSDNKHKGLDLAAPKGSSIRSSAAGTVMLSGQKYSGYGNMVIIRHTNELMTVYAHLDRVYVKNGQSVQQGENIGDVGSTGISSGDHLHFEVIQNNYQINPLDFLDHTKLNKI